LGGPNEKIRIKNNQEPMKSEIKVMCCLVKVGNSVAPLGLGLLLLVATLVVPVLVRAADCVPSPEGLVAWWPGEGNVSDIAGNNSGVTVSGVSFVPGEVGQAMLFNGVDGWVDLGDPDELKLTNSLTIEGWIKVYSWPAWWGMILIRADDRAGLDPYFVAATPSGRLGFNINDATYDVAYIEAPVSLGEFIHFAATLEDNGGLMRLYIDGCVVAETVTTVRPFRDLDPAYRAGVTIGNCSQRPSHSYSMPLNGLIDELSVYNRALTSNEVVAIFNAGAAGKCKLPCAPTILQDPEEQAGPPGASVSFTVLAAGTPPLSYQWLKDGLPLNDAANISGATAATLTLAPVSYADIGGYSVVVTNGYGAVTSAVATLSVQDPFISGQPVTNLSLLDKPFCSTWLQLGRRP